MEMCKYYNDAQSAVCLMVDDLSFTAILQKGELMPCNDWGYGLLGDNSIYTYFERQLLKRYPEIKGTFFYPLRRHSAQNLTSGYEVVFCDDISKEKKFFNHIKGKFEIAWHGLSHGKYLDENNCEMQNNWQHEFAYWSMDDIASLKLAIRSFENQYDIKLYGGKYPGYVKNKFSQDIIEALNFKWWATNVKMINKKTIANKYNFFGNEYDIFEMPTNLAGDCFKHYLKMTKNPLWHAVKQKVKAGLFEAYIEYLYNNGLIISVQEHFMNLRTDGKRQTPNIYDDIDSLKKIYALLRGADVWYATCSDIAHYKDSYVHSNLKQIGDNKWEIKYNGIWDNIYISVKSKCRYLMKVETGEQIKGQYKNGAWVFNDINSGVYIEN